MSTDPGFIDTNEEQSADKPDSDVWPIIGASVGSVLLVFGVVVCAVMILKRRNRCKCAHKRTNSHDTSSNCHMTQENYLHDHAVDITKTDTTYDTTCSTKKNKEVETGNIYNKLDTDINATYDHAYNKRKNVAIKAEEVTYDTAEMEALVTKADNKPDRFGDTDEDAYNHINGEQLKTCKTDNVYGISSILGNGAREQGTSNIKDTHSEGDTYSHINNASRKCSRPDNVYGVPNKLHTSSGETKHQEGDYDVSDKDIQVLNTDNEYSKIGTLS
ncbi:uncharacterized protein LOC128551868 [Mercenaria mercenaria]|uniref:uncharacterized protein LOC128551868 n=1 Tax=Mercenaria mercenaria TaxID=6596 RepID=UPI00234F9CAB|nr:uncharacterized protein LOC128551868 [Mercenaria mercenaria]